MAFEVYLTPQRLTSPTPGSEFLILAPDFLLPFFARAAERLNIAQETHAAEDIFRI